MAKAGEGTVTVTLGDLFKAAPFREMLDDYVTDGRAPVPYILSPQQAEDYERVMRDDLTPEERAQNHRCREADRAYSRCLTNVRERLGIEYDEDYDYGYEYAEDLVSPLLDEVGYGKITPDNAQQVEDLCVEFVERLRGMGR